MSSGWSSPPVREDRGDRMRKERQKSRKGNNDKANILAVLAYRGHCVSIGSPKMERGGYHLLLRGRDPLLKAPSTKEQQENRFFLCFLCGHSGFLVSYPHPIQCVFQHTFCPDADTLSVPLNTNCFLPAAHTHTPASHMHPCAHSPLCTSNDVQERPQKRPEAAAWSV